MNYPKIDINIENNEYETPLIRAVKNGKIKTTQMLINNPNTDINMKNNLWRDTALMFAIRK